MEEDQLKDRLKVWLKDKFNLTFLLVLLSSIVIRLYYFFLTKTQPLWYDESDYMASGLRWAFDIPYKLNPQRPPLLPFLESLIFRIGGGEVLARFLLILLPSIGLIVITYLIGKEMYNKKVGLIASFVMAVFWEVLFNTTRLHVEVLLLFFIGLSIYFFWKIFIKNEKGNYFWIFSLAFVLAFLTKYTTFLLMPVFFLVLFLSERFKLFKNKYLWFSAMVFFILLIPYFVWSYVSFNTPFSFLSASGVVESGIPNRTIMYGVKLIFGYIPFFTERVFLVILIIGLLTLFKILISFDILLKEENKEFYADVFNLLFISVFFAFFIIIMRGAEDRWVLPVSLPLFLFIGKGFALIYDFTKKYNKYFALVLVIVLLAIGSYEQLKQADLLIKDKKDSYLQVKDAAIWMKEHSNPGNKIFSISLPQTAYYSMRETLTYTEDINSNPINETNFEEYLLKEKPRYLTVSIFEYLPPWILEYIDKHKNMFKPVQAYLMQDQKPLLVIYELNYTK